MRAALSYDAVILAGGRGSRMAGADKGLLPWRGQPLVDHVLQRLRQQTITPERIWISANRHLTEYAQRAPVVTDEVCGFEGPLRGIQAALRQCQAPWLLVVPCDGPQLMTNLAQQLFEQAAGRAAWARSDHQLYPLCCLLPRSCLPVLDAFLQQGQRRVQTFLQLLDAQAVHVVLSEDYVNLNDPDSLSQ